MSLPAASQLKLFALNGGMPNINCLSVHAKRAANIFASNCARFGRLNSIGLLMGIGEVLTSKGYDGDVTEKTIKGFARLPVFDSSVVNGSSMAQAELEVKFTLKPLASKAGLSVAAEFISRPVIDGISSQRTQEYISKPFKFSFKYGPVNGSSADYLKETDASKIIARLFAMNEDFRDIIDLFNATVSVAKKAAIQRLLFAYNNLEPELKILTAKYGS
jgi:hypothetical protein